MTDQAPSELAEGSELEVHRPYIREVNQTFGQVYGLGGAGTLVLMSAVYGVLVYLELLSWLSALMPAITAGLISLAVVRSVVKKKEAGLRRRVLDYCETNKLDTDQLREYYARDNIYPYFEAILQEPASRKDA